MSDCCKTTDERFGNGKPGGAFELIDHHGRKVTDQSYRGRYILLFFGFTNCRVVCPTALKRLSAVVERLGASVSRLQPLYVTVDPERDTPAVMKTFLEASYPRFTGLTGPRENVEHVKSLYKVFAKRAADPEDPDGYQMPHTAFAYLIDPEGRFVAHFTDTLREDELVTRIGGHLAA